MKEIKKWLDKNSIEWEADLPSRGLIYITGSADCEEIATLQRMINESRTIYSSVHEGRFQIFTLN